MYDLIIIGAGPGLNKQNHDALFAMEERNEVEILRGSSIKGVEDEAGRPRVCIQ